MLSQGDAHEAAAAQPPSNIRSGAWRGLMGPVEVPKRPRPLPTPEWFLGEGHACWLPLPLFQFWQPCACGDRPWILDSPFEPLVDRYDLHSFLTLTWFIIRSAAAGREEMWRAILHGGTAGERHRSSVHRSVAPGNCLPVHKAPTAKLASLVSDASRVCCRQGLNVGDSLRADRHGPAPGQRRPCLSLVLVAFPLQAVPH